MPPDPGHTPVEPTHVRLVRHGEVAAEHQGTFYGGADVPLSSAGRKASLVLARRLADVRPDRIASSPLSRARLLAEELARHTGAPLTLLDELKELDRGGWTHRSRDDVEAESPGAVQRYLADPEGSNGPGGEAESVFAARVWGALDALVADLPGGRLVVVAHGHVLRVAMRRLTGWDAVTSLGHFVDYHAVVEARLRPDGTGELLSSPGGRLPGVLAGRRP